MEELKSIRFLGFLLLICAIGSCKQQTLKKNSVIAIQPLGNMAAADISAAAEAINKLYAVETVVLSTKAMPSHCFIDVKSPRYRADSLLKYLLSLKPDTCLSIIGLTLEDISTTKYENGKVKRPESRYQDFGIMGLGYRPGKACVVSKYRLKPKGKQDNQLWTTRFQKVVVHEIGHNLGLPHCPQDTCFMRDAVEKISSIDEAHLSICEDCKKRI